jgi:hypothetical protein
MPNPVPSIHHAQTEQRQGQIKRQPSQGHGKPAKMGLCAGHRFHHMPVEGRIVQAHTSNTITTGAD